MDTWATSSETPQINARWGDPAGPARSPLPMSMRPQAHEIIRTWAFYTIVKSCVHHRDVPWGVAMVSGLVLDPNREKISKSKGNNPTDPKTLLEKHGVDAVRYWALSGRVGTDYPFNEEDLASGRRLAMKLWNASKLVLGPPRGLRPGGAAARPSAPSTRACAAGSRRRSPTRRRCSTPTSSGSPRSASRSSSGTTSATTGSRCRRIGSTTRRPRGPRCARPRRRPRTTLLSTVLRLFAPFVPHVVEAIHQAGFRTGPNGPASITRAAWPSDARPAPDDAALVACDTAVRALSAIRRWRSENKVSPGKPLGRVRLALPAADAAVFAIGRGRRALGGQGPRARVRARGGRRDRDRRHGRRGPRRQEPVERAAAPDDPLAATGRLGLVAARRRRRAARPERAGAADSARAAAPAGTLFGAIRAGGAPGLDPRPWGAPPVHSRPRGATAPPSPTIDPGAPPSPHVRIHRHVRHRGGGRVGDGGRAARAPAPRPGRGGHRHLRRGDVPHRARRRPRQGVLRRAPSRPAAGRMGRRPHALPDGRQRARPTTPSPSTRTRRTASRCPTTGTSRTTWSCARTSASATSGGSEPTATSR